MYSNNCQFHLLLSAFGISFSRLTINRELYECFSVKQMVEIKSPTNIKEMEGKLGVSFRGIAGKGERRELYDSDKLVTIKLERGEAIVLIDNQNRIWELSRSKKRGYYNLRNLEK